MELQDSSNTIRENFSPMNIYHLAESIVRDSNLLWYPVRDARNETPTSGEQAPDPVSTKKATENFIANFGRATPSIVNTVTGTVEPAQRAFIDALRRIGPGQLQAATDLFRDFGPELQRIGEEISRAGQLEAAQTQSDVFGSSAFQSAVENAREADKIADPTGTAAATDIGSAISRLVDFDPNKLSGSELAEIERFTNRDNAQTGVAGVGSPTAAISNALTFGNQLNNRRQTLSNVLAQAASAIPSIRNNIFNTVTSRVTPNQAGLAQFQTNSPVAPNFGELSNIFGQNVINALTSFQTGENQKTITRSSIFGLPLSDNSAQRGSKVATAGLF